MDISKVKAERLSVGELLGVTFALWFKSIWPSFKLSVIFFIFTLACLVLAIIGLNFIDITLAVAVFPLSVSILSMVFSLGIFALSPVAEANANGYAPSVIDGLARVFSSLIKFIGAGLLMFAFFMVFSIPLILFKNALLVIPVGILMFVAYIIVTPYISFFPMAIFLRDAGVLDSFKYSFYMVRGRWLEVWGIIILFGICNMLLSLALMFMIKMGVSTIYAGIGQKIFALMFSGGSGGMFGIVFGILGFILASIFAFSVVYSFWITGFTSVFINLEARNDEKVLPKSEYDDDYEPVVVPQSSKATQHEITEMFKNIKEVNVNVSPDTERKTALGPQNREQALREFKKDDQITMPTFNSYKQNPAAQEAASPVPPPPPVQEAAPEAVHEDNQTLGGMPTITIREHISKDLGGLPSIYKPEDKE